MIRTLSLLAVLSLPAIAEEGWTDLIPANGLTGWVDGGGKPVTSEKWVIEKGVLHLTGKGGGSIFTAKHYADFELQFEWKIAPKGNSGVKYRMTRFGKKGLLGPEYQVFDDQGKEHTKGSTAGLYHIMAPDQTTKKLKPVGEWNSSRIVAKGKHLQHFLNGAKVIDITIGSAEWKEGFAKSKFTGLEGFAEAKGPIMLQDHGSKVWYRAMRVREL